MKKNRRSSLRRPIVLRLLSSVALIPHVLTITLQMERSAMAGSCTVGAVSVCSGSPSGADVTPFYDYNSAIAITTDPGLGLDITNGDYGMSTTGDGGVSFVDDYASTITTNGEFGIYIENDISGHVSLVSTGSITATGAGGDGIRIENYGEDVIVRAHDATGDENRINVRQNGTGAVQIVSTGTVIGHGTTGIFGDSNSGTSMTIDAVDTQGASEGIFARNYTSGALSITSTGLSEGISLRGIIADNYGTDVSVTAQDTKGGETGLAVNHYGTGFLDIVSSGTATGGRFGLGSFSDTSSTTSTIHAADTTGGEIGIDVSHLGTGAVTITSTGTATGTSGNGIVLKTGSGSSGATINANNAQGGGNGIRLDHRSLASTPGNTATITTTGHIQGGSGYGISTETLAGVLTDINVEAGSVVESTDGNGIYNGDGDSDVTIADGATVNGRIDLGLGSDTLTLGAGLSGTTVLDGGGGGTDTLNISGAADETRVASDITNWSVINLDDSTLTLSGGDMTVGTAGDMATGIFLRTGSVLDGSLDDFTLAGNLSLAAGTRFLASGNGGETTSITGNVDNAGTISAVGGGAGDTIEISGDYVGNDGTVTLETALVGDTSTTDRLNIQGDTSGTSILRVINVRGVGAATSEGIELITVGGVSNGVFTLLGDYEVSGVPVVIAGAYSYRLFKGNRSGTETDNWYLRSELTDPEDPEDPTDPTDPEDPTDPTDPEDPTDPTDPEDPTDPTDPEDPTDPTDPTDPLYQPGVPVYEAYPQTLLGLNNVSTLQQRVGNRFWLVGGDAKSGGSASDYGSDPLLTTSGIWARIEGAHSEIDPRFTTAGTEFGQDIFRAQAGMDSTLLESADGTLMAGLSAHYTHGEADIASMHGIGKISTDGYGVGSALTWYGNDGMYLDGRAQATWYESDLRSITTNRVLVSGNDAFGYALSLEGGKRIALDEVWSMTPQAQMVYSRVDFDRFTDIFGASVSLDKGASLRGRLGLTLDRETAWQDARGLTSRLHTYGHREHLQRVPERDPCRCCRREIPLPARASLWRHRRILQLERRRLIVLCGGSCQHEPCPYQRQLLPAGQDRLSRKVVRRVTRGCETVTIGPAMPVPVDRPR